MHKHPKWNVSHFLFISWLKLFRGRKQANYTFKKKNQVETLLRKLVKKRTYKTAEETNDWKDEERVLKEIIFEVNIVRRKVFLRSAFKWVLQDEGNTWTMEV